MTTLEVCTSNFHQVATEVIWVNKHRNAAALGVFLGIEIEVIAAKGIQLVCSGVYPLSYNYVILKRLRLHLPIGTDRNLPGSPFFLYIHHSSGNACAIAFKPVDIRSPRAVR